MSDLISVIIACRNGTNYVKEAIDSIKAQIGTHANDT